MTEYDASSNYLENRILNWIFRSGSTPGYELTTASGPAIALFNADPTDAFTTTTELSGSSYSRKNTLIADWTVTDGVGSLTTQEDFSPSSGSWGYVTHVGLMSASIAGSMLFYAQFPLAPVYNSQGEIFSIYGGDVNWLQGQPGYCKELNNRLLKNILRKETVDKFNLNVYITLYTTMPSYSDTGGVEVPLGLGYTRIPIAGTSFWNTPVAGSIVNQKAITLISSATGDIGEIKGLGIRTSAAMGGASDKLILLWEFNPHIIIMEGDGLGFDIGNLSILTY